MSGSSRGAHAAGSCGDPRAGAERHARAAMPALTRGRCAAATPCARQAADGATWRSSALAAGVGLALVAPSLMRAPARGRLRAAGRAAARCCAWRRLPALFLNALVAGALIAGGARRWLPWLTASRVASGVRAGVRCSCPASGCGARPPGWSSAEWALLRAGRLACASARASACRLARPLGWGLARVPADGPRGRGRCAATCRSRSRRVSTTWSATLAAPRGSRPRVCGSSRVISAILGRLGERPDARAARIRPRAAATPSCAAAGWTVLFVDDRDAGDAAGADVDAFDAAWMELDGLEGADVAVLARDVARRRCGRADGSCASARPVPLLAVAPRLRWRRRRGRARRGGRARRRGARRSRRSCEWRRALGIRRAAAARRRLAAAPPAGLRAARRGRARAAARGRLPCARRVGRVRGRAAVSRRSMTPARKAARGGRRAPVVLYQPRDEGVAMPLGLLAVGSGLAGEHVVIVDGRFELAPEARVVELAEHAACLAVTRAQRAAAARRAARQRGGARRQPAADGPLGRAARDAGARASCLAAGRAVDACVRGRGRGAARGGARCRCAAAAASPAFPGVAVPGAAPPGAARRRRPPNECRAPDYSLLDVERHFEAAGARRLDYCSSRGARDGAPWTRALRRARAGGARRAGRALRRGRDRVPRRGLLRGPAAWRGDRGRLVSSIVLRLGWRALLRVDDVLERRPRPARAARATAAAGGVAAGAPRRAAEAGSASGRSTPPRCCTRPGSRRASRSSSTSPGPGRRPQGGDVARALALRARRPRSRRRCARRRWRPRSRRGGAASRPGRARRARRGPTRRRSGGWRARRSSIREAQRRRAAGSGSTCCARCRCCACGWASSASPLERLAVEASAVLRTGRSRAGPGMPTERPPSLLLRGARCFADGRFGAARELCVRGRDRGRGCAAAVGSPCEIDLDGRWS